MRSQRIVALTRRRSTPGGGLLLDCGVRGVAGQVADRTGIRWTRLRLRLRLRASGGRLSVRALPGRLRWSAPWSRGGGFAVAAHRGRVRLLLCRGWGVLGRRVIARFGGEEGAADGVGSPTHPTGGFDRPTSVGCTTPARCSRETRALAQQQPLTPLAEIRPTAT